MNTKTLALAAVLVSGFAVSAHAQGADGDLIVGFVPDSSVSTGTTTNLEVDIGSVGAFLTTTTPGTYQVANLGSDLSSTYGSTWAASTLSYGIVGGVSAAGQVAGQAKNTAWASNGPDVSTPYSQGNNATPIPNIVTMYSGNADSVGGSSTTALTDLATQTDAVNGATLQGFTAATTGTGASFSTQMNAGGGADPFALPGGVSNTSFLNAVNSGANLDLDTMKSAATGTSVPVAGYFTLTSGGILDYVIAGTAIPEPSTYAAVLGAISIGFVILRRRNRVLA